MTPIEPRHLERAHKILLTEQVPQTEQSLKNPIVVAIAQALAEAESRGQELNAHERSFLRVLCERDAALKRVAEYHNRDKCETRQYHVHDISVTDEEIQLASLEYCEDFYEKHPHGFINNRTQHMRDDFTKGAKWMRSRLSHEIAAPLIEALENYASNLSYRVKKVSQKTGMVTLEASGPQHEWSNEGDVARKALSEWRAKWG